MAVPDMRLFVGDNGFPVAPEIAFRNKQITTKSDYREFVLAHQQPETIAADN